MLFQSSIAFCASLAVVSVATALPAKDAKVKPPTFFLAGDSTTAVQSVGGGGQSPLPETCINMKAECSHRLG